MRTRVATSPVDAGRVCVARHPILDKNRKVFGYELSFQPLPGAGSNATPADKATAHVIADGIQGIGLDNLVEGKKAFVNVGRNLLLEGIPSVLPPNKVVIELSADVEADSEVVAACRQLREKGYAIAVDDFVLNEWTADLVSFATFLKVDLSAPVDPDLRKRFDEWRATQSAALVATQVETLDTFERASRDGYRYFQGFFFGRPLLLQGRDVPGQKLANLRLLQALNDPNLSVHQLEELVKHDAALCYRILRTVNSAAFALQTTVHSIREALLLLGRDTVRRWASLWALAGLGEGAHVELIVQSTVRARCCEVLAGQRGEEAAAEGFLVGMCSLLDAILERPMESVLADLPLADEARKALLGEDNATRRMLDCAIAYERGQWGECAMLAQQAGLKLFALPSAFADALRWSRELQATAH